MRDASIQVYKFVGRYQSLAEALPGERAPFGGIGLTLFHGAVDLSDEAQRAVDLAGRWWSSQCALVCVADAARVVEVCSMQQMIGQRFGVSQHHRAVHHEQGLGCDDGSVSVTR